MARAMEVDPQLFLQQEAGAGWLAGESLQRPQDCLVPLPGQQEPVEVAPA